MLVEFKIDGNKYKIECPVEDQDKDENLATAIDKKATKLRSHLKSADEKTLLAILCLTIQDEANSSLDDEAATASTEDLNIAEQQVNKEAIVNINQATKRIEELAKKIERC